jgi:hypothetical protein
VVGHFLISLATVSVLKRIIFDKLGRESHEISKWKAIWIGHILRRYCLLRQVIEGKIKGAIEVTGRRKIRGRKLLDDLKEGKGY